MYYNTSKRSLRDARKRRMVKRLIMDARKRRIERRRIQDAYLRGYRDAINIKELFTKLFASIKVASSASNIVYKKVLLKLQELAKRAYEAIKSGSIAVASKLLNQIKSLCIKIKNKTAALCAAAISKVLGKFKRAKVTKGSSSPSASDIEVEYTIA